MDLSKNIKLYARSDHPYNPECTCSFCIVKKNLITSLTKTGWNVITDIFNCNWDYYYPAAIHFNYAIEYQNKIFGNMMFETDKLPYKMVEFAKKYFDYIICDSKFLYDVWKNYVEEKYLIRSSCGIDSNIFKPDGNILDIYPDKFKFLNVAAWQAGYGGDRKGQVLLVNVFKELFRGNDKVMLIIKSNSVAPDNIPDYPNIKIIKEKLPINDMAALYRSCAQNGAFISLHEGEGFGLCVLEALYSGCKIGATGWSGVMDFLNDNNSTLFPYTLKKANYYPDNYYTNKEEAKCAKVDIESVKKWMLKAVSDRIKDNNFNDFEKYDWDIVTKNLIEQIESRLIK